MNISPAGVDMERNGVSRLEKFSCSTQFFETYPVHGSLHTVHTTLPDVCTKIHVMNCLPYQVQCLIYSVSAAYKATMLMTKLSYQELFFIPW